MLFGLTFALLNTVIGAVDVPGGLINANAAGPFGPHGETMFPKGGPDGILEATNPYSHMRKPHPYRQVKPPETLEMQELFPVTVYSRAMLWLAVVHPEIYKPSYLPEILIHCRTNLVANTGDPRIAVEGLKRLKFIVSFADHHNETTTFADIVLPDSHFLERLVPMASNPYLHHRAVPPPGDHWAFNFQQPVVKPAGEARYWLEVLFELAERLGIQGDMYASFNAVCHLEGEHRLRPDGHYTYEDICDRWAKAWCGPEHGLEYFKEHGYYKVAPRTVQESYPRIFHEGRIPLYLEHFIRAGQDVKEVTEELGIPWDVSDYQGLVEWKPCPAYLQGGDFDLWAVNTKLPYSTFTFSHENAWISDLIERNGKALFVTMNTATARKKGLKEGDLIAMEAPNGVTVTGYLRVSEGCHPEVISIPGVFGRWLTSNSRMRGAGTHINSLITYNFEAMDKVSAALDICVKVKVTKTDRAVQPWDGEAVGRRQK
jgi:anaerobic selenocysteine-containing dehydrogenase